MYKRRNSGSSEKLLAALDRTRPQPDQGAPEASAKNLEAIRRALQPVKDFLTAERVEAMALEGMSQWTICGLFECGVNTINTTPELLEAFNKGRANIAKTIRGELIKDAIEDNNVSVKLYLDKIYSKEDDTKKVELSVSARPLENVSTEQLLEIELNEDTDQQD